MELNEHLQHVEKLFNSCKDIAAAKGKDYTNGNADVLAFFKDSMDKLCVDPKKSCWIMMNKHYQAITAYVRTGGQSESEPISERIKDMINFLTLLNSLIVEENETPQQ